MHSAHHGPGEGLTSPEDFRRELTGPADRIRRVIGRPPASSAWLHGSPAGDLPRVVPRLRDAGVGLLVSGFAYERLAVAG